MEPKTLFLLAIAAMEGTRLRSSESGKARASTETLFTIRPYRQRGARQRAWALALSLALRPRLLEPPTKTGGERGSG
jgi:hypothetical protein